MDGQRPMEELSEAPNLSKVLVFRDPEEGDRVFVAEKISGPTTAITVVRLMEKDDEVMRDNQRLETESQWEELLAEVLPSSEKDAPKPNPKLLLILARPEPSKQRLSDHNLSRHTRTLETPADSKPAQGTVVTRVAGVIRSTIMGLPDGCRIAGSFLGRLGSTSLNEKSNKRCPAESIKIPTPAASESRDQRRKLQNMPFTLSTFQFVVKRMSIHSWVSRVISRADVPTFERTVTEMPLYSGAGKSTGSERAIKYNCRTSNAWENDMALAVTHFPKEKLTFAVLFGSFKKQEKNILTRLEKAGDDAAHPMLLPGVLAELERTRQMDAVEEMIDELETQTFLLNHETVATWKQSSSTKAERNRQKTKAWLNTTFARNLLHGHKSLLFKMRQHIDELPLLVDHHSVPRYLGYQEPSTRGLSLSKVPRHGTPLSRGSINSISDSWPRHGYDGYSGNSIDEETLASEFERVHPLDKYQENIQQAGMRMKDRLITMIGEYDDKIRDCTMRVDGMAMATQWSHGETNMEIATASGEDSSQMRSIALVTMVFLPGTFFASIFSMSFFDWMPDSGGRHPIISGYIWIYFLITVAFTVLTLTLFWYFILHRQKRNRRRARYEPCPV